jgi:phage tail sheath protein FI
MPEYSAPGVYIEEVEMGPKLIEGVSTNTAGFLGETERGPTFPRLVTSWSKYQKIYGGYFGTDKYLPYSVEGFFMNGGQRCYIARIVKSTAEKANLKLKAVDDTDIMEVTAIGEGEWGKRIAVKTEKLADRKHFKLSVFYWKQAVQLYDPTLNKIEDRNKPRPDVTEVFDKVSIDKSSPKSYEKTVNKISNLIQIQKLANTTEVPKNIQITALRGETCSENALGLSDYLRTDTEVPGQRKGLSSFNEIDDISIVYVPNTFVVQNLYDELVSHCEKLKDRFAITDSAKGVPPLDQKKPSDTEYAALYCPWIHVIDPNTGSKILVPPGGFIAGIYARSDTEKGVHKAPANEIVKGAVSLEFSISKSVQDVLNPEGINCIRAFSGRGIRVWGARTLSSDSLWKYISVRRLFLYLEESIEEGTQWVVFEPNDEKLWNMIKQSITQFLTRVWKDGALMGRTPEEAFFVKCDRTTMTQHDIDNGRLIVIIGVAPVKPAEFVIFRIAQWKGGSQVSE